MDLVDLGEVKDKINLKGISRPAACGLVAVLVLVAIVCAVAFAPGQGGGLEIASAAAQDGVAGSESGEDAGQASTHVPGIFVHVTGCVHAPGLIELPQKSRVAQAIEAAGGFKDDADTASINLARELSDGEQLYVPSQAEAAQAGGGAGAGLSAQGSASVAASTGAGGVAGAKININKASASELTALPGIGNATAEKIVNDRKANGPFIKVDDLTRVSGIGDKKFEAIRELICV